MTVSLLTGERQNDENHRWLAGTVTGRESSLKTWLRIGHHRSPLWKMLHKPRILNGKKESVPGRAGEGSGRGPS